MTHKIYKTTAILAIIAGIFIQSAVLGQNVINDSFYSPALDQTRYVDVYLPPGYNTSPDLHYPVIFYLHGWGGSQNDLSTIVSYTEQKINNGEIDPVIMVCASNYTAPFAGSMYVNSPVWGDFEDYMVDDLISWLDTTYRTVPDKHYRSLMGHSMGAYGAFRYGALHHDKFCALAAYAAPANLPVIINDYQSHIQSENSGPPYSYNYSTGGYFTKMIFLGAGAWSPDLNSPQDYVTPQNVEYPFDQQCALIDTVFDKWTPGQVTTLVHQISQSDSVGILFGCGTSDQLYFYPANLALKDTLDQLGLTYQFNSYSGGHSMPAAFKNRSLIYLDSIMPAPVSVAVPTNLLADNITSSSADLSWTENSTAISWEIMLDVSGFDTSGYTPVTVTGNPYTWSGLAGSTTYDWYVRSVYAGGIHSNWAGPDSFTTLSGDTTQTIQLIAGWNINSFAVTPDSMDMLSVYGDLVDSGRLIKIIDETGAFVQNIPGIGWMNTIGDMALTEGYYVKVDTLTELQVTGIPQLSSYDIPLTSGWNIMGYPIFEPQSAMDVIQPLIDSNLLVKVIDEAGGFIQNIPGIGWMNTIGDFKPGKGYYIKVTDNVNLTLDYPVATNMIAGQAPQEEPVLFTPIFNSNPFKPMNIVVNDLRIEDQIVRQGHEVAVFDNDLCVGAGVVKEINGSLTVTIVAGMDDPTTEETDGFSIGDMVTFKYLNEFLDTPIELVDNEVEGSNEYNPFSTYVCSLNNMATDVAENLVQALDINCYPNPVKDRLTVAFNIPTGQIHIEVTDISGHRMDEIINDYREAGKHALVYQTDKLLSGFYVIRIQAITSKGTFTGYRKFIKM